LASRSLAVRTIRLMRYLAALSVFFARGAAWGQSPDLVDVGGHKLDVARAGSGSPTIVLVAGLGSGLDAWEKITSSATGLGTVVAYSRSGLGRSERGPHDSTARGSVDELHALLKKLELPPPYVLVGASYGGILVRLYTSLYPSEVAGLVIVEGSHEEQVKRWGKLEPGYPAA